MSTPLSDQEIADYLAGFNKLCRSWTRNRQSADARAKGLYNYEKWFKSNGITLYLDPKNHEWKIDHIAFESQGGV